MDKKYQKLKVLYLDAFDDGEAYADFFLHNYYNGTNIVTHRVNGEFVSVLYMVDKQAILSGHIVNFPFLSAISTRSDLRGKKLISSVMMEAFTRLDIQGVPFAGLYPFSHRYYERYGFVTTDNVTSCEAHFNGCECEVLPATPSQLSNIYANYCASNFDGYILRDECRYKQLLDDWTVSGNRTVVLRKGDELCYVTHTSEQIEECVGNCALLNQYQAVNGLEYTLPFGKVPNTMVRIVNVIEALKCVNYSADTDFAFSLTDSFYPNNDGTYSVKIVSGVICACKTSTVQTNQHFTIEQLTRLLLCGDIDSNQFTMRKFFCFDKY